MLRETQFHSILKLMKEVRSHQEEVPYNYGVFILYYATFFYLIDNIALLYNTQ